MERTTHNTTQLASSHAFAPEIDLLPICMHIFNKCRPCRQAVAKPGDHFCATHASRHTPNPTHQRPSGRTRRRNGRCVRNRRRQALLAATADQKLYRPIGEAFRAQTESSTARSSHRRRSLRFLFPRLPNHFFRSRMQVARFTGHTTPTP